MSIFTGGLGGKQMKCSLLPANEYPAEYVAKGWQSKSLLVDRGFEA